MVVRTKCKHFVLAPMLPCNYSLKRNSMFLKNTDVTVRNSTLTGDGYYPLRFPPYRRICVRTFLTDFAHRRCRKIECPELVEGLSLDTLGMLNFVITYGEQNWRIYLNTNFTQYIILDLTTQL